MQREYADVADFAIIYVEEAHPIDGWMYGQVKHFTKQPVTLVQRSTMARVLENEMKTLKASPAISLCVDLMDNAASLAFGALPERLVILKDGKLQFVGGAGPSGYSIPKCESALKKLL